MADVAGIAEARKAGYSDAEILDHIKSTGKVGGIDEALRHGYSPAEILTHVSSGARPAAETASDIASAATAANATTDPGLIARLSEYFKHSWAEKAQQERERGAEAFKRGGINEFVRGIAAPEDQERMRDLAGGFAGGGVIAGTGAPVASGLATAARATASAVGTGAKAAGGFVKEYGPVIAGETLAHVMGAPGGFVLAGKIGSKLVQAIREKGAAAEAAAPRASRAAAPAEEAFKGPWERAPEAGPTGPRIAPAPAGYTPPSEGPWGPWQGPSPTGPKVADLGAVPTPPAGFDKDLVEAVRGINKQSRAYTLAEAMPLIRALAKTRAAQAGPMPTMPGLVDTLNAADVGLRPPQRQLVPMPQPPYQPSGAALAPDVISAGAPAAQPMLPPPGGPIWQQGPAPQLALPKPSTIYGGAPQPELGLPAPDWWRKAAAWTPERVAHLQARLEQGAPMRDIAGELGLTRNAVIGKSDRLRRAVAPVEAQARPTAEDASSAPDLSTTTDVGATQSPKPDITPAAVPRQAVPSQYNASLRRHAELIAALHNDQLRTAQVQAAMARAKIAPAPEPPAAPAPQNAAQATPGSASDDLSIPGFLLRQPETSPQPPAPRRISVSKTPTAKPAADTTATTPVTAPSPAPPAPQRNPELQRLLAASLAKARAEQAARAAEPIGNLDIPEFLRRAPPDLNTPAGRAQMRTELTEGKAKQEAGLPKSNVTTPIKWIEAAVKAKLPEAPVAPVELSPHYTAHDAASVIKSAGDEFLKSKGMTREGQLPDWMGKSLGTIERIIGEKFVIADKLAAVLPGLDKADFTSRFIHSRSSSGGEALRNYLKAQYPGHAAAIDKIMSDKALSTLYNVKRTKRDGTR